MTKREKKYHLIRIVKLKLFYWDNNDFESACFYRLKERKLLGLPEFKLPKEVHDNIKIQRAINLSIPPGRVINLRGIKEALNSL